MFGRTQGGDESVRRQAAGSARVTITPDDTGIAINFSTPAGPATVSVFRDPADSPNGRANEAVGGVPMFFSRDGDLGIIRGSAIGLYSFSGSFDNPNTFFLDMSSGGSGPGGVQRFTGSGSRQTVAAPEPTVMLLIGGALAAAAWVRRKPS
jgi:hypothetical protein